MTGARVLVTGMGSELGTRVTNLLEGMAGVDAIVGIDRDPPRRRIPRAAFHRIDPRDELGTTQVVRDLEPTVLLHMGVYEPNASRAPAAARLASAAGARNALAAASRCSSLEHIVVRSGIEVYGRGRGQATRPDETVPARPTSGFGRSLLEVEQLARAAAHATDVPLTVLRLAPVVGPHVPSPLGRYLRLPVVGVSALSDLPFSLLHQEDAAVAVVSAFEVALDGIVNVVAPGAVTAVQAVRMGGRLPAPMLGPSWRLAGMFGELVGAPLPDHVRELLIRGRCADGGRAAELDLKPTHTTPAIVQQLYEWAEVLYLDVPNRSAA
ncbi:MAG: NAD-dependent epimerase/dehydratase family protein [Acidimicrobiales bacterium]